MFREFAYEKNTIEILQIPRVSRNIIYIYIYTLVVEKLMDQKGHIDGHVFSFFPFHRRATLKCSKEGRDTPRISRWTCSTRNQGQSRHFFSANGEGNRELRQKESVYRPGFNLNNSNHHFEQIRVKVKEIFPSNLENFHKFIYKKEGGKGKGL